LGILEKIICARGVQVKLFYFLHMLLLIDTIVLYAPIPKAYRARQIAKRLAVYFLSKKL